MRVVALMGDRIRSAAAKERGEELPQTSAEDGGHASEPLPKERLGHPERAKVIPAENQHELHHDGQLSRRSTQASSCHAGREAKSRFL